MRHTFAVLAAAGLLIGTIATGAEARHGMGGFQHVAGRFGGPIIGGVAPMAPIYNSSGGYTVTPSIETPVSPASPGSVFHYTHCGAQRAPRFRGALCFFQNNRSSMATIEASSGYTKHPRPKR